MWASIQHPFTSEVAQEVCSKPRKEGNINLIDPRDSVVKFLCKWIIKAYFPCNSNLVNILKFKLMKFNPSKEGA